MAVNWGRLFGLGGRSVMPKAKPMQEMGTTGFALNGGYIRTIERAPEWTGKTKYTTSADIVTNVSIVAASVHYFLNLLARPVWTARPVDDSAKAQEAADFVQEVMEGTQTPWQRVVRRAAMYRFHGFGIQEWVAKKRKDGRIVYDDVEPRPQHTIERWEIDPASGNITGAWQRSPMTNTLLGLPRSKIIYLVDDTLTDSPEGLGVFRHMAEPYDRLKRYLELEARGFERDLRGIPIGRAPYTLINSMVKKGTIDATTAANMTRHIEDFVGTEVKKSNTSLTLDSQVFEYQSADGLRLSGTPMWGLELLSGGAAGLAELDRAVDRINREMARIMGTEILMMGDQGGNRALAVDKSRNLYLVANSVLSNVAAQYNQDFVGPLWTLNGFDDELRPRLETEDVSFVDAQEVAQTIASMAQAGAVLQPDDPVIDDVRDLLGVSRAPELTPEQIAQMQGQVDEGATEDEQDAVEGKEPDDGEETPAKKRQRFWKGWGFTHRLRKFDASQPRDERGRWSETGVGGGIPYTGGDLKGYSAKPAKSATELFERTYNPDVTVEQIVATVPGARERIMEVNK